MVSGGGHVVLPLLREAFVTPGWVSDDTFLAGCVRRRQFPGRCSPSRPISAPWSLRLPMAWPAPHWVSSAFFFPAADSFSSDCVLEGSRFWTCVHRTSSPWGICRWALNIPLRELKARLAELDSAQEIVAYCRGEYCVLSFEAVALLRARGFNIRRLEDGLPEWRAAGLPVITGSV
jgi:rhodanese-related sulfurtransferase